MKNLLQKFALIPFLVFTLVGSTSLAFAAQNNDQPIGVTILNPKIDYRQYTVGCHFDPINPAEPLCLEAMLFKNGKIRLFLAEGTSAASSNHQEVNSKYQLLIKDIITGSVITQDILPQNGAYYMNLSDLPACTPGQGILALQANWNGKSSGAIAIDNTCPAESVRK